MNYEKKYNEALKRAKKAKNNASLSKGTIRVLDIIFPELKESEDERIRKSLIDMLKNDEKCYLKEIAWLEKQGTSYTKTDVENAYLKGINDAKQEVEKQYKADYQIRKDIATFIFNYRGDIKDRAKWMDYLGIKVSFVDKQDEQKTVDKVFSSLCTLLPCPSLLFAGSSLAI